MEKQRRKETGRLKKTFLRKILSMVMCFTMVMGTLGGCDNKEETKHIETKNMEHEPLTIFSIHDMDIKNFSEELHKKYPEVNIEIKSFEGQNASGFSLYTIENGDIPDIYISTILVSPESQQEYLLDLSNYEFVNSYTTTMLNEIDNEGGIYLLPSSYQLFGINYNKTIMEENGWEVPKSFEELEALAPEIEAAGYDVMRAMFDLSAYPFYYFFDIGNTNFFSTANGEQWKKDFIAGNDKAAGNEELLESVRYFKRWIDSGLLKSMELETGEEPKEAFMRGESVFFLCLGFTEYTHATKDGKEYEFGIMPWLSEDGNNNMFVRKVDYYFGVNKELEEKGNEQKLEDALKIMEFLSSKEGQNALVEETENPWLYTAPLVGSEVAKESPYYPWNDCVTSGHTIPLVYVGWEDLLIPMAQDITQLMKGKLSPEQLLEEFDKEYNEIFRGQKKVLGVAETDMTFEDTAKLCGNAVGIAADADAALVSLGGYHDGKLNRHGVNWYFYSGAIDLDVIDLFKTRSDTISVLEMTGAEIKELVKKGFDLHGDGDTFEYVLSTKGDMELEDNTVYKVAVGTKEITKDLQEKSVLVEITTEEAIIDYVTSLGTFGSEDIIWE